MLFPPSGHVSSVQIIGLAYIVSVSIIIDADCVPTVVLVVVTYIIMHVLSVAQRSHDYGCWLIRIQMIVVSGVGIDICITRRCCFGTRCSPWCCWKIFKPIQ